MFLNSSDYPAQSFKLEMLLALLQRVALNLHLLRLTYAELEGDHQEQNWHLLSDDELLGLERSMQEAIECLEVHLEAVQFERRRRARGERTPPK